MAQLTFFKDKIHVELDLPGGFILKARDAGERWYIAQLPGSELMMIYQAHDPLGNHLAISVTTGLKELLAFPHVCLPAPLERRLIQQVGLR